MDYSPDFAEDYEVSVGTDFVWDYQWQPLDLTGCSASFVADFGTLPCTIVVSTFADDPVSEIKVQIPNATTAGWTSGTLYAWRVLVTFPGSPATVLPFGHGRILAV